ncbi:MAG: sigma-70 family RNA polymerase sigma factor [Clostridia bacterium]|nr:sigma-70 family RNA polymerase sigma factor [Clostridia bacterium]
MEDQSWPLAAFLRRAQNGDQGAYEELLRRYLPFILAAVADVVNRQISVKDDEASAGILAFSEAIKAYHAGKGRFLPFARTVIRRRVYDYLRRQAKFVAEVPCSHLDSLSCTQIREQAGEGSSFANSRGISAYEKELEAFEIREEIACLSQEMRDLGITFADVADSSPRQEETKKLAVKAATCISKNAQLLKYIRTRKKLPLKEIAEDLLRDQNHSSLSSFRIRKTLERHRAYILAVALILAGDYIRLKAYARW